MADGTRRLAAQLGELDDPALAALLAARSIAPTAGWRSLFDAAEALLAPGSVDDAVARLPKAALDALSAASRPDVDDAVDPPHRPALRALALIDGDGHPYAAVSRAIRGLAPAGSAGPAAARADDPAGSAPLATRETEAVVAERVFTNAGALADVLLGALRTPLTRIGSGALGAADRRRLSDELSHPDDLDALVELAVLAGLLRGDARTWQPTAAADEWLRRGTPDRWLTVAEAWAAGLPDGIRGAGGTGWRDAASWPGAYPADPTWPARAERLRDQAEAWGIVARDGSEPSWAAALRTGDGSAGESLRAIVPHEVDRVYLQNDLSAIAPGPLAPALDVRLRTIARRESHAQASSYRFSADSVRTAFAEGETEDSILEFLSQVSLTGVPQPLDYLVRQTARRHGAIRVQGTPEGGTRVTVDDQTLAETLEVDQSLRAIGLVGADDGSLFSRAGRDSVLWALTDAGYPAVAIDPDGAFVRVRRHGPAAPVEPASAAVVYAPLIAALREADPEDADAAWLGRELENAVRDRAVVELDVQMPDGATRAFRLEATGFGGGRVRGREVGADVERTLPVSLIRTVRRV